jgi:diphthamide synthase (EF-2-diphthine--ammonia ligase)
MMIRDFIASGFKTLICAANAKYFSAGDMGKTIGADFASSLPPAVDPCGENGEFHTFVYDGPVFKKPVAFGMGDVVQKKYFYQVLNDQGVPEQAETSFWFQDLVLSVPV